MKKICALTMVRNDEFFLEKWINYYGRELGKENLYVFFDGLDQDIPTFCEGVNVLKKEKVVCDVVRSEKNRLSYLSARAKELFEKYEIVIGTDADEFLIVDPAINTPLATYLSELKPMISVSGLGVDVGQHLKKEKEINPAIPLLGQREYAYLSCRYTKPNTIMKPVVWGSGFHRVRKHDFHIDNNLYLFHFGSMDYAQLVKRNRLNGWSERHLRKRARTIFTISGAKISDWDKTTTKVRIMQRFCRQIFTPNKPSTLFFKFVVKIPSRFKNIV